MWFFALNDIFLFGFNILIKRNIFGLKEFDLINNNIFKVDDVL